MVELLNQWLPNVMDRPDVFIKSIQETFIMVGWSGAISFVVGLFLGVLITVTKPGNILEHPLVYQIIDKVVNLFRSVPFIILLAVWRCRGDLRDAEKILFFLQKGLAIWKSFCYNNMRRQEAAQ